MPLVRDPLEHRLLEMLRASAWFMDALVTVRDLELGSWCIGAGAIRNLVWDALHGKAEPSALSDVDVVHFDASDLSREQDLALQAKLCERRPAIPWEVTNQAGVHLWFEACSAMPSIRSARCTKR
ncbi:nucleotidyltransferase family protein [Uliginosibacterium paludis]|uniref:Nucleotidyltransferase family protein n=1 Tax=Uliginosibacterium paludis TaxID=1615952 RepID=A0ABV2CMK5_9RHOO